VFDEWPTTSRSGVLDERHVTYTLIVLHAPAALGDQTCLDATVTPNGNIVAAAFMNVHIPALARP
jgi:hypothetical protein